MFETLVIDWLKEASVGCGGLTPVGAELKCDRSD